MRTPSAAEAYALAVVTFGVWAAVYIVRDAARREMLPIGIPVAALTLTASVVLFAAVAGIGQ